jgi:1-acyl-sn-glycerol-3-phosphate acyltransferase
VTGLIRAAMRLLGIAVLLLAGLVLILLTQPWRRRPAVALTRQRLVRWWYRTACRIIGIRVQQIGDFPDMPALIVSNHVSWLDIPVIGSAVDTHFLSKAEVRDWPLIGWLAQQVGTLFIRRGANQTASLAMQMGEHLRHGSRVLVFPEGTTSDGQQVRHFFPRLFSAALHHQVPIVPVSLCYHEAAGNRVAPFIDDDTFLHHFLRVVRTPGLKVTLRVLETQEGAGMDRKTLARETQKIIEKSLNL